MAIPEPNLPSSVDGIAVLIPARQPDVSLPRLVEALLEQGVSAVVVIDDGSKGCDATFDALAAIKSVHLLRHAVNMGKGRALKTGFNHVLTHLSDVQGIVTADADGQHSPRGIVDVARALKVSGGLLVLGCRTFSEDVPLRSRFGNIMTRRIFAFVTGAKLSDTQTGLRGFRRDILPDLLLLDGERYEFEMTVLAHLCRNGRRPIEVPIETIYIDGNRSSHFNPVRDSMRIYFVLLRFYFSSLAAAGIDFAGFTMAFALTHNVLASVAFGRLSSLVNFALNKRFVFQSQSAVTSSIWRYYLLVLMIGGLSYGLIRGATCYLHMNVFVAKIIVDVLLSFISFSIQRTFVFRTDEDG